MSRPVFSTKCFCAFLNASERSVGSKKTKKSVVLLSRLFAHAGVVTEDTLELAESRRRRRRVGRQVARTPHHRTLGGGGGGAS